ncbi:HtaA domain-containing protein [Streptomyces sp. SCSIO ZS0520]|uniref:HtaA domain-containing protein n=1 Tax=Streptomyces sp. SCSIO ZS0520 TaxID=2892996 RepID=UPI0021D991E9|nr:HtaA domain-containing protein [Streptomyces sp. SCSIO ZS0520]
MAVIRRRTAFAASVAAALTLGAAGSVALPAVAAPGEGAPAAKAIELKDGTLDWGFKESFRKYLLSPIAQGRIEVADGAEQAPDNGPFTFTGGTGSYDTGTHAVDTAFRGGVHFWGHNGTLDITLSDLKLATTGTAGSITADVTTGKEGEKPATDQDVPLAGIDLSEVQPGQGEGGAMVFQDIPAKLTKEGAAAFQGFYQEGTALDPATLTVTPAAAPTGEPTTGPTGEPTATPSGTPTAEPSGTPTATPSTSAPAPAGEVFDATLSWGLKQSFRTYILTGGEIKAAGGAEDNGNGWDFPYAKAELDSDAKKVSASFEGSVRFLYPGHGIDMSFGGLAIEAEGTKGTLVADVTTPQGTNKDVQFATLDLGKADWSPEGDVVLLDKIPAKLTAAGAEQFENETTGSPYPAGTVLDPVTVALAVSDDARLPGGSGGSGGSGTGGGAAAAGGSVGGGSVGGGGALATTGSSVPAGALVAGAGVLAAAGAGAVFLARRRPGTGQA